MINPYFETKLGKLYHGNCVEVMNELIPDSIDMILSDPPYGISYDSNRTSFHETIHSDAFSDWNNELPKWLDCFYKILSPTGVGCCCCCGGKTPVSAMFTMEVIKKFNLIQTLIWKKFIGLGWHYRPAYETIVVFSKSIDKYAFYDTSKKCSNVIEINQHIPQRNKTDQTPDHPTQKPVKLMEHLLLIHTKENDLVLDPFMGSGTTAIACERLNRRWVGIEIKKEYCDVSKIRIQNESNQGRLFI